MSLLVHPDAARAPVAVRKVHVGCGPHALIPGWCNTDLRNFPGIDLAMDAAKPWPFTGLTHVFGEHFIEHLPVDLAVRFLVCAGNALAPGGRIRLSTPNLAWVIATCFSLTPPTLQRRLDDTITLNRGFYGWGHQFLWTEEVLTHVMLTVGYEQVTSHDYGQSDDPELADLERHGRHSVDHGHSSVIIVEGVRGERAPAADPALDAWFESELLCHVRSGH